MARVPQVRESGEWRAIAPDSRIIISEPLDGLGIYNPARRNIVVILFLMVWLGGWGAGEYFALTQILRSGNVVVSLFLLVWVSIWTLGGLGALGVLLWNLIGSERLFITAGALVHSIGFGFVQRKRMYPLDEVGGFRIISGSKKGDNGLPLSAIEYEARGGRRTFGMGMSRAEAEASLAAITRALPFQPRSDASASPPPED